MKKTGSIILLSIVMVMLSFNFAFAADLQLVDTNPAEGYTKVEPKNVMIKLFFNEEIAGAASQAANKNAFILKDSDGKTVPMEIYYDRKDAKKISLLISQDLISDMAYDLSIAGTFMSDSGNTLGADKTLSFHTRTADTGGTYMIMMVVMIVVMIVITMRDAKKKMAVEAEDAAKQDEKINPYKLAKTEGVSVEEAVKRIEEKKAKEAKKPKKAKKNQQNDSLGEKATSKESEKTVMKVRSKRVVKINDDIKNTK